jgi:hypothetical protein
VTSASGKKRRSHSQGEILPWLLKRIAISLVGAFALLGLGALTGCAIISVLALVFPFIVWAKVVSDAQQLWGDRIAAVDSDLFNESREIALMTSEERRRKGYPT